MHHTQTVTANPRGTNLSRYLRALVLGHGDRYESACIAKDMWLDSPSVALTLRSIVEAQDTSSALGAYGIAREFIEEITGVSIFGRLQPSMTQLPFRVPTPHATATPVSYWVGEAAAKPVGRLTLGANLTLEYYKFTTLCVITDELARFSAPSAESVVRNALVRATAKNLDNQFLNPSVALIAGIQPASIGNGSLTRVSTESTAAQVLADLNAMTAQLTSWNAPFWVMGGGTAAYLAGLMTAGGAIQFPNITATGGTLLGINVVASTNITGFILLVDANRILYARDVLDLSLSRNATVEMDSEPAQGESSPITAVSSLKSFFQNNLVGLKSELSISYLRCEQGAVVSMVVTY